MSVVGGQRPPARVPHLAAPERDGEVKADVRQLLVDLRRATEALELTSSEDHEGISAALDAVEARVEQAEVAGEAAHIVYHGRVPTPWPTIDAHAEAHTTWMRAH